MIPVRIDPLFWLMALGLGWLNSQSVEGTLLWVVVIIVSVFIHEMGHALTAKYFGQRSRVTLTVYGGVTTRLGPPLKPFKEFLVVLNGPLAGFCLYFLCLALLAVKGVQNHPQLHAVLSIGASVNLFWTFLNLLPVQPLDGGHLVLIVAKGLFGVKGVRGVYLFSTGFAALLTLGFILIGSLIGAAIFALFAFESYRGYQQSLNFTALDENQDLQNSFKEALQSLRSGNFDLATAQLEQIRQETGSGALFIAATEKLSDLEEERGEFDKSYALLKPIEKYLGLKGLIKLQRYSFSTKRYQEAIVLGERIHKEEANPEVALINAYSHAVLKEELPAYGWLKTAERDGLEDKEAALKSPYFDGVRR